MISSENRYPLFGIIFQPILLDHHYAITDVSPICRSIWTKTKTWPKGAPDGRKQPLIRDAGNAMKKTIAIGLTAGALVWVTVAVAQEFGTAAEARAMLDRAVAELKVIEAAALAKFNDKDNKQFRDSGN
jgi:hypothetical protein